MKRWVVRLEDGETVEEIVRAAGGDLQAIAEGRVFLGRRRVLAGSEPVRMGEEISIAPPQSTSDAGVRILFTTANMVAVDKPAGMPTIADHAGATHTLVAEVARQIDRKVSELHPTSRLDREVSGVVVFALTTKGISLLKAAREEGSYARRYVAISSLAPKAEEGEWDEPIGRADDPRHRRVRGKEATHARSKFRVVARAGNFSLLALAPITGRTHQLRVHAAHAGAPLVGDRVYGGPVRLTLPSGKVLSPRRILLHAARVTIKTPDGRVFEASAAVPAELTEVWTALGGDASAWDIALSCAL